MVDIINSLKVANRLKEINGGAILGSNNILKIDIFTKNAKAHNWTDQMINRFCELVKTFQNKKRNDCVDMSFATLFSEIIADPTSFGIKPLTGETLKYAQGIAKNASMATRGVISRSHVKEALGASPWDIFINVEPIEQKPESNTIIKEPDFSKGILIFPLNPFFPGLAETQNIAKYIETKYKGFNIINCVLNKGGDGKFSYSAIETYKQHRLGVNSSLRNIGCITSLKTFAKILIEKSNADNAQTLQSIRGSIDKSLLPRNRIIEKALLNEDGTAFTQVGVGGQSDFSKETQFSGQLSTDENGKKSISIICSPEYDSMIRNGEFLKILDEANITVNIYTDNNLKTDSISSNGKKVFNAILQYVNGKKFLSAEKRDTEDLQKSQNSLNNNDASINPSDAKVGEDSENITNVGDTRLGDANDKESIDWSWDNIKANGGAKFYVNKLYSDVEAIKKGVDDGGNPSQIAKLTKQIFAEVGKEWAAALTDAADFGLEGIGLGWIMPLIKKGSETLRNEKNNKKYEGVEAFVRDSLFRKNIAPILGNSREFIEPATNKDTK